MEISTFSTSSTLDTTTFPSESITCPSVSAERTSLSSERITFLPKLRLWRFTSGGLIFSPYTEYPISPRSAGVSFASTSPLWQWHMVFKWKKSTLPSSFKVGLAFKSVSKKYSILASFPRLGSCPWATAMSVQYSGFSKNCSISCFFTP